MKRSLHPRTAGFTLLEIMLVVMIIAVLAGSAIFFMGDNLGVVFADSLVAFMGASLLRPSQRVVVFVAGEYEPRAEDLVG